jgi:anti-anti-sigma regulatory factor
MATNDEAAEPIIRVGAARIEKIEETIGPWRQALDGADEFVTLDLSEVEAADVTLYQALLAFRRSLEERGRHLLLIPLPEGHPVLQTGRLLGIPLEHHFTLVGAGS